MAPALPTLPPSRRRFRRPNGPVAAGLLVVLLAVAGPAAAQNFNQDWVGVPKSKSNASSTASGPNFSINTKKDPNAQMLLQADNMNYDHANEMVTAEGHVQLYYNGSTVTADKLTYYQQTKKLRAEGNVILTEADGKIVHAEQLELSDDFRDGFVDAIQVESADKTRFGAARMERSGGRSTVFESGAYTACKPCVDHPTWPPKWEIKADRIIHDEVEKMIYFENARLDAFGIPLMWSPFFSTPDPTVKRKTGWLAPTITDSPSKYGWGFTAPFYWAIAPDYDVTLTPTYTTKQGLLMQAEWRQRFINGSYTIHAAGIFQEDPDQFVRTEGPATPGDRNFRGDVDSTGIFALNDKWVFGWDALLITDKTFFQDYGIKGFSDFNSFQSGVREGVSQLYLAGRGDRSYFDARVMGYYGFSEFDSQSQLPIVAPVIDYSNVLGQPILGGEVSYKINLTSLSRQSAEFDAVNQNAVNQGFCAQTTADPAVKVPANCLLRGIPGVYSRLSAETTWRHTIIDPLGQMWTPFFVLRGDVANADIANQPGVSNYIPTGDTSLARFMPAMGLEYRYPFISVQSWGTQTVTPIGQVIIRPNETDIGKFPNEDAQSLVFSDSNLFSIDKFSGWDRVEGGGRANVGMEYTAQFNQAGNVNALFGQSYQLFGLNSYAVADTANTGLDSGLQTSRSDYVARLGFQPNAIYSLTSRFRFDEQTFNVQRLEVEGKANFDRWALSVLYGDYAEQPDIGFLTRREGVLSTASVKVTQNWSVLGGARYDIENSQFDQYRLGVGYIDDCFAVNVSYFTDYSYSGNTTVDHRVMLQINLRTLGGTAFSQTISTGTP